MNEAVQAGLAGAVGPPPGGRLAEARQAQNLTPADVARQLKLSVWQVEALEAGRYQQLPGPVFVRGFIRNYARLLKLDPDEFLREAGDSLPQAAPRADVPPSPDIPFPGARSSRWPALTVVVAVIVGALVAYEFYWEDTEPTRVTTAQSPAPAVPAVTAPVAAMTSADPAAQPVAPAVTVAAAPQAAQDMPAAGIAEPQSGAELPAKPGERQVKLVFEQESWVEIRDRNERILFSQLNRPGTQQLVSGLPPFSVVVGNAQGVRMTYDDKPVDLASHTKIDVARLILQ